MERINEETINALFPEAHVKIRTQSEDSIFWQIHFKMLNI